MAYWTKESSVRLARMSSYVNLGGAGSQADGKRITRVARYHGTVPRFQPRTRISAAGRSRLSTRKLPRCCDNLRKSRHLGTDSGVSALTVHERNSFPAKDGPGQRSPVRKVPRNASDELDWLSGSSRTRRTAASDLRAKPREPGSRRPQSSFRPNRCGRIRFGFMAGFDFVLQPDRRGTILRDLSPGGYQFCALFNRRVGGPKAAAGDAAGDGVEVVVLVSDTASGEAGPRAFRRTRRPGSRYWGS